MSTYKEDVLSREINRSRGITKELKEVSNEEIGRYLYKLLLPKLNIIPTEMFDSTTELLQEAIKRLGYNPGLDIKQ
jgi:hypothetical protein